MNDRHPGGYHPGPRGRGGHAGFPERGGRGGRGGFGPRGRGAPGPNHQYDGRPPRGDFGPDPSYYNNEQQYSENPRSPTSAMPPPQSPENWRDPHSKLPATPSSLFSLELITIQRKGGL